MTNAVLRHEQIMELTTRMMDRIIDHPLLQHSPHRAKNVYPIPRGGIPVGYMLSGELSCNIVDTPEEADFFVDDIIDSGATRGKFKDVYPEKPFFALIDKTNPFDNLQNVWVTFPWEVGLKGNDESATDIVTRLLQYIGEDVTREGLRETPHRVLKAWKHWCSGYGQDPADIMKVFEDGAEGCDQMVVRKDIPCYSHCEHHLAAVIGTCTIAYIPRGKVLGLSKLDRLVEIYARRLQVQERLTNQIADALQKHLDPIGVGVWISARHLCVESRGVQHQCSDTITTALRGAMRDDAATRAEFLALART